MTLAQGLSACDHAQAGELTWQFKALADLWTGAVISKEKGGQIKEKI